MRIRTVAAAAASAALLALGTAQLASAAPVSTAEEAGFQGGLASAGSACNGCWHFRYVQAQVTLPDVSGSVDSHAFGGYGLSVRLTNGSESAVLGISASTGGTDSTYNAAFNLESRPSGNTLGGCVSTSSPATPAGDTVLLSVYFDGTRLSWNVTDKTDAAKDFSGSCADPDASDGFTQYQIGTEFGITPWSSAAPALVHGATRLAGFSDTVATNRTGIRGSAGSASWPVQRLTLTADGTSAGQVRASTPYAWGSYAVTPDSHVRAGRNFGVWLPAMPS